jgi:hypothetical protein
VALQVPPERGAGAVVGDTEDVEVTVVAGGDRANPIAPADSHKHRAVGTCIGARQHRPIRQERTGVGAALSMGRDE